MHRTILCALIVGSPMLSTLPAMPRRPAPGSRRPRATICLPAAATTRDRTFAGAITKTAINGEINCIDLGGYGAVTITKSITIDCTGTYGSILAGTSVAAVLINITPSADDPHRSGAPACVG